MILRQGDDLDHLGGISVITRILVGDDRRVRGVKTEMKVRERRKCHTAESEGGGRAYEQRDAGGLSELEKAGEWILPLRPSEGTGPRRHLDWSPAATVSDF